MAKLTARQQVVKDFARSRNWVETRDPLDPPRVAYVSPGPPGIGKSRAATRSILAYGGRVVEPSHDQARERHAEARHLIKTDGNLADKSTRHIQGMGRRCLYLADDEWSSSGWEYGRVACDGCPKKQECPSMRQFWEIPDASFGVHQMADWNRGVTLVIDEMPEPVQTTVWDLDEMYRLCHPGWPTEIEQWRGPIERDLHFVLEAISDEAYSTPDPKPWGTVVPTTGMCHNNAFKAALDRLVGYFDTHPMPGPDPDSVRKGSIRPQHWPNGNLESFFRAFWYEAHGHAIPTRGRPETACARVYGDEKGRVVEIKCEHRLRWSPPTEDHVVLDSLYADNKFVYNALYTNWDEKAIVRDVKPTPDGVELVQFDTHAFTRSRSLFPSGRLTKPGINARVRALRAVLYKVLREHPAQSNRAKPTIGLIDHKAALEDAGFDFTDRSVLSLGDHDKRIFTCSDPLLEDLWQELERRCNVVVGYHGGVTGSNKFIGCRVLAILGDPYGHIGMLAEEARTLGVSAQAYVDWRTHCAAVQEIYRARLLDTDKDNPKTVLYFGRKAPAIDGLTWVRKKWAEGGRLPSKTAHYVTTGLWRMVGAAKPVFAGISDAVVRLHATLIGHPLLELREAGVITQEMSHSEHETYRRAAKTVALDAGWRCYSFPHPLGDRRAVSFWAPDKASAKKALDTMTRTHKLVPKGTMKKVRADAETRNLREDAYEAGQAVVQGIRDEVNYLKLQRKDLREARPDMTDVAGRMLYVTLDTEIRNQIKAQMKLWRSVRSEWRRPQPSRLSESSI